MTRPPANQPAVSQEVDWSHARERNPERIQLVGAVAGMVSITFRRSITTRRAASHVTERSQYTSGQRCPPSQAFLGPPLSCTGREGSDEVPITVSKLKRKSGQTNDLDG